MSERNQICHFSFHKNLTIYYGTVSLEFCKLTGRRRAHFNSFKENFLLNKKLDMRSVNNHFIPLEEVARQVERVRFSLFVRDPRDLLISGYHYHKRGAEDWCNVPDPTAQTLVTVNMRPPSAFLREGESVSACLQRLSFEDGLKFEYELRRPHFSALKTWAEYLSNAKDLICLRYEDILQDEPLAFRMLAEHYEFDSRETEEWCRLAARFSAKNARGSHIRNPNSGQWRSHFSKEMATIFEDDHGKTLSAFGYS